MKSEQLLSYIGEIDPTFVERAENRKTKPIRIWHLAPIAACLIMCITIMIFFGEKAGWLGNRVYTVQLSEGTLDFHKMDGVGAGNLDFELGVDATTRNLAEAENHLLFGDAFGSSSFISHGIFSIGDKYGPDKSLLHVEAMSLDHEGNHIGGLKIIVAAGSIQYISDTVIETDRVISVINGIEIAAGFWVTKQNSRGERNIIYLASYELEGVTVYIECGGSMEREEEIRAEIAHAIDVLTQKGVPDLSAIIY